MNISTSIERISPAMAAALLEGNIDNRRVKPSLITQYASDMKQGRWLVTGDPIIISDDGLLNDGQHRLKAIIVSGATVECVITRGVSRESRAKTGIGSIRTAGDVVQMFHIPNGNAVAAMAKLILSYEAGDRKTLGSPSRISKTQVIDRCRNDDRLVYADRAASALKDIATRKHVAFCRYLIQDGEKSEEFFGRLRDGAELYAGHPVLSLRNWWLRNGRRAHDAQGIEAILRGWNAFRDGRELQSIRLLQELPLP